MEEWKEYDVTQLCDSISCTFNKSVDKVILVNTSDVLEGKILNHELTANKNLRGQFKKSFKKNDILYSEIRPANKRFAYVDIDPHNYIASTKLMVLRNKDIILPKYLYFLLTSKNTINVLQKIAISRSGTFPQITFSELSNIKVLLPPLVIQDKILSILSALDNKIENNRKINENLEAQAQALFKSWFVDFEPFRDQPFVDSELGPIPQGWKVVGLSSIAEYINGLAMQKFRPLENEIGLPVLKIKELGNGDFDSNSEFCSPSLVDDKFIINNGDIIFSWSGTLMVKYWCGGKGGLNQHLFNVVPKEYPKWFVYQWTKFHLANFIRIAKDKAVTMGHIKRGELDKAKVAVPTRVLFDKINFTMVPIHEQMVLKEIEIRHLSKLRDTLLPKLMSGEIKV